MRSLIFFGLLFSLFPNQVYAYKTISIDITVLDWYTHEPVSNVKVYCRQMKDTLWTDELGRCTMIDIDEKSITIELFHSNYLPAIKYEVVKRGKKNPQFQYRMTPNKELLNSYMQPIIEKELKILRSIDSIQYASCEEDSMPIRFNAHFPGGDELIDIFVKSALVYPEEAIEFGEQGNVFVSFIIEKSGEITTVNIERGISKSLDREAKRLISNMPNWVPEYCNGRPQRVKAQIPIQFVIM